MKKAIISFLLAAHLTLISAPAFAGVATGTNAFEDAQRASETEDILRQVEEENNNASEQNNQQYRNSTSGAAGAVGSGAVTFGLGMGMKNLIQKGSQGTRSNKTDTQSNPSDWSLKKKKMKPWELLLIAAFMARELREVFAEKKEGHTQIDDSRFTSSFGKMEQTNDPRTKVVLTIFKAVAHLSQEIEKKFPHWQER